MFPQLTAAIADIAAFMDDDEDPNFDAARQQAVDAYSAELLPTALGGEWTRGQPGVPWPDQYAPELFDHPLWFRRRDARGPRTWQDCVVLGSPYRWKVVDETGELALNFLVAAQLLLERKVGVWTNNDLSWWDPAFRRLTASADTWRADMVGTRSSAPRHAELTRCRLTGSAR